jgi:hypothetical protein
VSARRGFQPAVRRGKKARIAIDGVAGSGKTWTALLTARELIGPDGRIGVLDTERGSAALYADEFVFDELPWEPPYDPRELAETILAEAKNFDVLIVDSLSHFWRGEGGTLDIVEASGNRTSGGNRFAGWKSGTPAQNSMIDALLLAPCHIVVTMRSAQEWVLEKDEKTGRTAPRRIGMAPVQRNDLEFEFTVVADLDLDHTISISKSRCRALADRRFPAGHGQKFGQILHDWLEGAEPEAEVLPAVAAQVAARPAQPALNTDDGLAARIATAIAALGADRGKFLGQYRISISGGKPMLSGKSADDLRVIAAALGILDEGPEHPEAPSVSASAPVEPVAATPVNGTTPGQPAAAKPARDLVGIAADAMQHIEVLRGGDQTALERVLGSHGYKGEPKSHALWVQRITSVDELADLEADLRTAVSTYSARNVPSTVTAGTGDVDPDDIPFLVADEDATRSVRMAHGVRW